MTTEILNDEMLSAEQLDGIAGGDFIPPADPINPFIPCPRPIPPIEPPTPPPGPTSIPASKMFE